MSKARLSLKEIVGTKSSLTELAAEAAEISRMILEAGGELTPEIESRLTVNTQSLLAKVDGYNYIIDEMEAQAAIWKRRKEACAAIEKRFSSNVESLWTRIKMAMKELGKTEIKGNLYRFKLSTSAGKLELDESKLPAEFKMVVQTTVPDKEKIKAALKDGFAVPGAKLIEDGTLRAYENAEE